MYKSVFSSERPVFVVHTNTHSCREIIISVANEHSEALWVLIIMGLAIVLTLYTLSRGKLTTV